MAQDPKYDVERRRQLVKDHGEDYEERLRSLRDARGAEEEERLGGYAAKSSRSTGRRREEEHKLDHRTDYARDRDRIIHSQAFYRLSGKTQVFLSPQNPLVSTRMTHTIQVSQIARSLARALGLNEDLTEAIALGHDLGHSPFGHNGETVLSEKCQKAGLPPFRHNVHSLRVVDFLEKGGEGLNLTWEVREGILCHDGEMPSDDLSPQRVPGSADPSELEGEELRKYPSTPEACLVRLCDRIAYAGKDIEDGIEAGLFDRSEIPEKYAKILGNTNKMIMDTLAKDIVLNFDRFKREFFKKNKEEPKSAEVVISLSPEIRAAVNGLIADFNYPRIYSSKDNLRFIKQTNTIVASLFDSFHAELRDAKVLSVTRRLDDFGVVESGPKELASVQRSVHDALVAMPLGEMEDLAVRLMDRPLSFKGAAAMQALGCHEHAKRWDAFSEEERRLAVSEPYRLAKLRIVGDNVKERGGRTESPFFFLAGMNERYILSTSSAEVARDYLASLTDRMAITIFKNLNIPESIV